MKFILPENLETMSIDEIDYSTRTGNALKRAGVKYLGDFIRRDGSTLDVNRLRNIGQKSIPEISAKLFKYIFESFDSDEAQVTYLKRMAKLNSDYVEDLCEFADFIERNFAIDNQALDA